MQLKSSAFDHESYIPQKYTCDGANISPPLKIIDVPVKTQSLVLILEDPDVPHNLRQDGMWDHWVTFNIPPQITEILEGHQPVGKSGIGTSGKTTYEGPCPPDGEHRYFFKLYALDTLLSLPEKATKQQVEKAIAGHILEKAELIGLYGG